MRQGAGVVYDAFLSYTRKGHPEFAQRIHRVLDGAGLRVFMDNAVSEGAPISEEIIAALAQSMTLIVVYSRQYLGRNACQEELRRVFIAAEEEGDPSRRILVVNPEDSNDHIAPAELRDARYVVAGSPDADLSGLIRAVRDRSASLPGPLSVIKRASPPRWLPPRIPGTSGFVGRHGDLWRLHTALRAADFPLTHAASSGSAAVVAGMAGIGKSSLAYAYAWHFGAAYQGGVYLTSLTGTSDFQAAVAQQAEQVRELAYSIGVPVAGTDRRHLPVLMGDYIDSCPGSSLWIIDDLPSGLDPQVLHQLLVPGRRARTIFTSRDAGYGDQSALVPLDGLVPADGAALLTAARAAGDLDEQNAARHITERLGGHPLALSVAAASLRNRHGVQSYAEYAATLEPDHNVLTLVGQSVGLLSPDEQVIVELAGFLDSQPLPAELIEMVLSVVARPAGRPADAGLALDRLGMSGLARRDGTWWRIHPLVSDAARRAGPAPATWPALAFAAARGIVVLGGSAASKPLSAGADVIRLARKLAASPALQGTAEADLLRELMAGHYESLGDVVEAGRVRRLLAASQPGSPRALTAAALACNASGDYANAASFARRALGHERAFPALWALADALDGLARYTEADDLWRELDTTDMPSPAMGAQQIAYEVARVRAHLARGQLREASILLKAIRARYAMEGADDTTVHHVNSATVQLAVLCLQTGREKEGRRLASSVVTFYRDRNAEKHAICLEAELAWAEAAVSLPLLEMNPDKRSWSEAEARLRRLHDSYQESAGSDSALTMTIAVQLGLILVRVGKRNKEAMEIVTTAIPVIKAQLGDKHPLWLRSQYILGLARLRQNEFKDAYPLLETAWAGQKQVLGPRHPETLSTQLELGCVLRLYDAQRSRQLISEVRQALPGVAGRKNFNYGRAFFASTLLQAMPAPAVRLMWETANSMDFKDPDGQ
jgi:tetratricopeptide (TPR) repeat protein